MLWPIWFRLMGESRPLNVMCKSTLRAFARFVHTDNVYLDILYRIDEDPVCDNIIVLRRRFIHERYSNNVIGVFVSPHFEVHDSGSVFSLTSLSRQRAGASHGQKRGSTCVFRDAAASALANG